MRNNIMTLAARTSKQIELINPAAKKIACRIYDAEQRIGDPAGELLTQINEMKETKKQKEESLSFCAPQSFRAKELRTQAREIRKKLESLEAERDNLIDNEMDDDEFRLSINSLIKCYEEDTAHRAKELRKHLAAVHEILETQFDQSVAYEKVLLIIKNKLNSRSHDQVIEKLSSHRINYANLSVASQIGWLLDEADHTELVIDSFSRL